MVSLIFNPSLKSDKCFNVSVLKFAQDSSWGVSKKFEIQLFNKHRTCFGISILSISLRTSKSKSDNSESKSSLTCLSSLVLHHHHCYYHHRHHRYGRHYQNAQFLNLTDGHQIIMHSLYNSF